MTRTRRPPYRLIALLGFLSAAACAGRVARSDQVPPFARAEALEAQRGAPDLFGRAERARGAALASDDPAARADHAERARLWLAAALAESRRIAHARAASAAEARIAAAEAERAGLERARQQAERALQRIEQAQRTRAQLARAFERAELDALKVGSGDRRLDPERLEAAQVLAARAQLTLAAARALGLPDARLATLDAGEAVLRATAAQRLAHALAALQRAEAALGEARALRAGPSQDELAALFELARVRGLVPQPSARGVTFSLAGAFGSDARLTREGQLQLLRLGDLLRAHPHGAVQLEVLAAAAVSGAPERIAEQRGERLAAALAIATPRTRVQLVPSAGDGALALVLPAYTGAAPVQ